MADWSNLPENLIGAIANRLDVIDDAVAISHVCTSWRSAVLNGGWKPRVPQLPWLLLTRFINFHDSTWLWSLHRNTLHDPNFSILNHASRCWGSPNGWVFTQHADNTTRLINPLTKTLISLPPLPPHHYIEKALVFDTTTTVIVVAIFSDPFFPHPYILALARPGYAEWVIVQDHDVKLTLARDKFANRFEDVVCYKGRVFGVRFDGTLMLIEIDEPNPKATNFAPPLNPRNRYAGYNTYDYSKNYLVESGGDLLMAWERRCTNDKSCGYANYRGKLEEDYKVYKFNFNTKEWTKLKDLGGYTLFLGDNYSMSVLPPDDSVCRGNCIYSTRIYYSNDDSTKSTDCFMIIYDMMDEPNHDAKKYSIPNVEHITYFPAPVWLMPSLSF